MPRKSSGCLCCRRRKIKCDEGKPACRRCIDFRIECPGYERKPTQLQYRFKDQTYRVVSRASSEQRAVSLPGSDEHFQETVKPKREIQGPVLILPGPYDISSPILWQTQIYSAFLDVYLPRDACRKTTNPHGYIVAISNARGNHPALNAAMIAVSTGQLGAMYDDEVLLSTSLRAYGMALTQLNSSLACYGSASQDETLATITALALCEVCGIGEVSLYCRRGGPTPQTYQLRLLTLSSSFSLIWEGMVVDGRVMLLVPENILSSVGRAPSNLDLS